MGIVTHGKKDSFQFDVFIFVDPVSLCSERNEYKFYFITLHLVRSGRHLHLYSLLQPGRSSVTRCSQLSKSLAILTPYD
jgi:hypothetical protein